MTSRAITANLPGRQTFSRGSNAPDDKMGARVALIEGAPLHSMRLIRWLPTALEWQRRRRKGVPSRRIDGEEVRHGGEEKGKKAATKRELITPHSDTRYFRRDAGGRIKESDDVGRSLVVDRRRKIKKVAKPG